MQDLGLAATVWFRGKIILKTNPSVKTPFHKYNEVVSFYSHGLLTLSNGGKRGLKALVKAFLLNK